MRPYQAKFELFAGRQAYSSAPRHAPDDSSFRVHADARCQGRCGSTAATTVCLNPRIKCFLREILECTILIVRTGFGSSNGRTDCGECDPSPVTASHGSSVIPFPRSTSLCKVSRLPDSNDAPPLCRSFGGRSWSTRSRKQ